MSISAWVQGLKCDNSYKLIEADKFLSKMGKMYTVDHFQSMKKRSQNHKLKPDTINTSNILAISTYREKHHDIPSLEFIYCRNPSPTYKHNYQGINTWTQKPLRVGLSGKGLGLGGMLPTRSKVQIPLGANNL